MTYADKLKDPRWQKKRLEVLNREDWACEGCGRKDRTLHVHHDSYNKNPWDAPNNRLHCLCDNCHKFLHRLKIKHSEWEEALMVGAEQEPIIEMLRSLLNENKRIKEIDLTDDEFWALAIKIIIHLSANTEWEPQK